MTAANFAPAERLVVALEGGYVNNPKDPGGATCYGVTQRAWADFRGQPCTVAELKALTPAEVSDFYRELYWQAVAGDALPAGLDLLLFDGAVNVGRGRAVSFLQQALRLQVDGVAGPRTVAAAQAAPDKLELIGAVAARRAIFYRGLATYATFGTGWTRRLNTVATTARSWSARAVGVRAA